MQYNEDKRIKFPVPFLKEKTVLYVDSRIGTSHVIIAQINSNTSRSGIQSYD